MINFLIFHIITIHLYLKAEFNFKENALDEKNIKLNKLSHQIYLLLCILLVNFKFNIELK